MILKKEKSLQGSSLTRLELDKKVNISQNLISGDRHFDFVHLYFSPIVKLSYKMEYGNDGLPAPPAAGDHEMQLKAQKGNKWTLT